MQVLSMAKNSYCWVIGADDRVNSNSLFEIYDLFSKHQCSIILFERHEKSDNFKNHKLSSK